ncbi:hypothetical protein [Marichromatium bheemlicum]|uniref:histidine kinase n=1 Tax=Marichromatium bheemlicum TaxID=365339 RepID=A0ABX1I729_9GAMM|nr:hypothetical protein [Marichromatium bheemlicum]NKN32037.1 hypothetical protein [Marichromatium bheemlicum]
MAHADAQRWRRLVELECRSLLAEQARQLAHALRTPLSIVELTCETLQLELAQDDDKQTRLGRALHASTRLSSTLTETLRTNAVDEQPVAFAVAPRAARLVNELGGEVDCPDSVLGCRVLLVPEALDAALLHGLRLLGDAPVPRLSCGLEAGRLVLRLSSPDPAPELVPLHQLRVQVIERLARDGGGWVRLEPAAITLSLTPEPAP